MCDKKNHCELDRLCKRTVLQALQPAFMGHRLLNTEKKQKHQFQFRELFIFDFRKIIECCHRFFVTQNTTFC